MPESVAIVTGASQGIGRASEMADRHIGSHGRRGNQRHLSYGFLTFEPCLHSVRKAVKNDD
jgi:hypothetical protein